MDDFDRNAQRSSFDAQLPETAMFAIIRIVRERKVLKPRLSQFLGPTKRKYPVQAAIEVVLKLVENFERTLVLDYDAILNLAFQQFYVFGAVQVVKKLGFP